MRRVSRGAAACRCLPDRCGHALERHPRRSLTCRPCRAR